MSSSTKLLILCSVAVLAASLFRPQTSPAQSAPGQSADPRTACASDVQKLCGSATGWGPNRRLPQGAQGLSVRPVQKGRRSACESKY